MRTFLVVRSFLGVRAFLGVRTFLGCAPFLWCVPFFHMCVHVKKNKCSYLAISNPVAGSWQLGAVFFLAKTRAVFFFCISRMAGAFWYLGLFGIAPPVNCPTHKNAD